MRKRFGVVPLFLVAVAVAVGLVSRTARADDPPKASAMPSTAAATASAKVDDDDPVVNTDETAEDKELRRNYIRRTKRHLEDTLHASSRDLTDDERAAIKKHWRLSMRLWRIRHLAHTAGDKATVTKVDALLTKTDQQTDARLKELQAKTMPAGSAAPSTTAGKK